jgi:hypothetical protein
MKNRMPAAASTFPISVVFGPKLFEPCFLQICSLSASSAAETNLSKRAP